MGSLFKTPKMPKPPPEVAMPDPQDIEAAMAKKNAWWDAKNRKGREYHQFNQKGVLGPTVAEGGGTLEYTRGTLGGTPR
jgi:hypothetical protein